MSFTFLSHFYKQFTRSSSFGKEMATKIFLGLIALMVVVYSLAFGFALEKILADGLKQSDTVGFLNGLLVYYFVFEFMMRYFL